MATKIEDTPTPASISAARDHQRTQRAHVEAVTGVRIEDAPRPRVVIACICGGCRFAASATTEGKAIRSLAPHLVRSHGWAPKGAA